MKESFRVAMKSVAGGKIYYALLDNGKTVWLDKATGVPVSRRALDGIRGNGWVRMEELPDPPEGTKTWYRVVLSEAGRSVWMGNDAQADFVAEVMHRRKRYQGTL